MSLLVIVRIAYLIISTAAICSEDQHCRDCDSDTGSCVTECESGYFDLKCKSLCSRNCKNKKCKSVSGGTEVCTDGCVPGYQGGRCNIPCDSPGGNCAACVGGCGGGYCQLSSTCVSGCSSSYYGSDCKQCSSRCKTCNGYTGMCEECFPQYFGPNCEYLCEHCRDTCQFGCLRGCIPGFYGAACEKECSTNCGLSPMMLDNSTADTRPVINDTVECNQYGGDCLHGCVDGWFGPQCSLKCNINCRNGRCDDTGDCVDGCVDGWFGPHCASRCNTNCRNGRCNDTGDCADGCASHHFGRNCIPCPDNCINHTCHTSYGTCVYGCTTGYYGKSCKNTCEFCLGGKCDQMTGMCFKGCNTTGHKCTSICRNSCTVDDCQSCQDESEMNTSIGLATGLTAVVIVIVILACLSAIKRWRTKRAQHSSIVQHNDEGVQDDIYSVEYQAIDRYWLIRDEDTNMPCVPSTNQEERGHRLAMPVLAECFPTAGVVADRNTDTSLSSAGDNQSYIPMSQDVADSGATQISAGHNHSYTDMSQDVADGSATLSSASENKSYIPMSQDVADGGATQTSAGDNQSYTDMSQDVADGGATQTSAGDNQSYTDMSRDLPGSDPDTSQSSASDTQSYTHLLRDVFEDDPKTVVSYISPVVD
ncbi:multiple epidermal growth factor-like domains protein 10 [Haliotis cracherodii]|uniref:multiple epidermal growth factor-like domains protein 10 n=1 Tax=Haliotis cracherodii TaxID=6455 RepID=UPI0039EB1F93